jgi:hypothetical protein
MVKLRNVLYLNTTLKILLTQLLVSFAEHTLTVARTHFCFGSPFTFKAVCVPLLIRNASWSKVTPLPSSFAFTDNLIPFEGITLNNFTVNVNLSALQIFGVHHYLNCCFALISTWRASCYLGDFGEYLDR